MKRVLFLIQDTISPKFTPKEEGEEQEQEERDLLKPFGLWSHFRDTPYGEEQPKLSFNFCRCSICWKHLSPEKRKERMEIIQEIEGLVQSVIEVSMYSKAQTQK